MRVDKEKFKETFPRLYEEISNDEGTISIKGVRHVDPDTIIDELSNPDVISFIRRARTEEEALEIINFCEHRKQLKEKGLRSFGPYKPPGYYFKFYHQEK